MGIRTSARCDFDHSIGALSFVTQLRYADKQYWQYHGRIYQKEQLAPRINTIQ